MFGIFGKRKVELRAPISGRVLPLTDAPDPVFAGKMVGDGVLVDPVGDVVVAPCDGEIVVFFPTHHALGIRSPEGLEILIHVGIETVGLKGEGFFPLAEKGQIVRAGQELIRFDPAVLRAKAPSLLSPVVVTNMSAVKRLSFAEGNVVAGRDVLLSVELA